MAAKELKSEAQPKLKEIKVEFWTKSQYLCEIFTENFQLKSTLLWIN